MRRWTALAVAIAGCYSPTLEAPCTVNCATTECPSHLTCSQGTCVDPITMGCNPATDAQPDQPPMTCLGIDAPPFMQLCAPTAAPTRLFPDGTFLDTDAACDALVNNPTTGGEDACLVYGGSITLAGAFRPHGSRPLILFSLTDLEIDGTVDVAGHPTGATDRPAGSPGKCRVLSPGGPSGMGGGGGAGGSLGALGGDGGSGQNGGGLGASADVIPPGERFHAGCDGSAGGDFMAATSHSPGFGGGAIYLAAGSTIRFAGRVNASGGAGRGVQPHCGGDGGGSGGMIILDAPTLVGADAAEVFAMGGGGSSGGSATDGGEGSEPLAPNVPGTGGQNNMAGGLGGDGAGGIANPVIGDSGGPGAANAAGGGGGGGGIGVIHVRTTTLFTVSGFNPQP